jgi:uncharacterized SAM-binding protein YcdF (DUF218 family)
MINVVLVLGISDFNVLNKRLDRAIQEYKSFQQNFFPEEGQQQNFYLMISGCGRKRSHEYMFNYASKYIDPKYIIVEDKSMTTYENLTFSFKILEDMFQSIDSLWSKVNITICTSSFHIKRTIILNNLLSKSNFDFKFIHTNESITKSLELQERKNILNLINEYTNYVLQNN